jgi:hypothetical protein
MYCCYGATARMTIARRGIALGVFVFFSSTLVLDRGGELRDAVL